jgi:plasmid stability protein
MASITIRGLDEGIKKRLRSRAAAHGRSMEAEARELLKTSLATREISGREFLDSIRAIVEPLGGIDLPVYPRATGRQRRPPYFGPVKRRK